MPSCSTWRRCCTTSASSRRSTRTGRSSRRPAATSAGCSPRAPAGRSRAAERVKEIVVRHMWDAVDPATDPEGYLLHAATSLDISGRRAEAWSAGAPGRGAARPPAPESARGVPGGLRGPGGAQAGLRGRRGGRVRDRRTHRAQPARPARLIRRADYARAAFATIASMICGQAAAREVVAHARDLEQLRAGDRLGGRAAAGRADELVGAAVDDERRAP